MPSIPRAECFHSLAYTNDYREWWVGENLKRSDGERSGRTSTMVLERRGYSEGDTSLEGLSTIIVYGY